MRVLRQCFFGIETVRKLSSVAQERRTAFFVAWCAWDFPPDKGLLDHGLAPSHATLDQIGKWWGQRIFFYVIQGSFLCPHRSAATLAVISRALRFIFVCARIMMTSDFALESQQVGCSSSCCLAF
jgi:hypothetical protein